MPAKAPPPFPVVAPTASAAGLPPIPHISVKTEVSEPTPPGRGGKAAKRVLPLALIGMAAVVLLAGAGYFYVLPTFFAEPEPPPPVTRKTPAPAAKSQPSAPTPSETLNNVANLPGNAINKTKAVIEARRASGQADIDAILDADVADKPAVAPAPTMATATTSLAPGLTATTEVEVVSEASPEFRSFVVNAKVSSVFQGTPARAFINGRLYRAGDVVDAGLGIVFTGIDNGKRQLVFKDNTGAMVARKY